MRSIIVKYFSIVTTACIFLALSAIPLQANEANSTVNPSPAKQQLVNDLYPGLTSGALAFASASTLPEGTLLKAGNLVMNSKELSEEIARADEKMQPALRKNAFFILEQMATLKLLLSEARATAAKSSDDISQKKEQAIIQDHLLNLMKTLEVTDEEIVVFYVGSNR